MHYPLRPPQQNETESPSRAPPFYGSGQPLVSRKDASTGTDALPDERKRQTNFRPTAVAQEALKAVDPARQSRKGTTRLDRRALQRFCLFECR